MLTPTQYKALYNKRIKGLCSDEELEELAAYEQHFYLLDVPWDEETMGDATTVKHRIENALNHRIDTFEKPKVIIFSANVRRALAAAILLVVSIASYIAISHKNLADNSTGIVQKEILPGGNKAVLTLDNGTTVDLSAAQLGNISADGHILTNKEEDGKLNYGALSSDIPSDVQFHTIRTPRGGQYQISLPDGTQVWLNAESSIRFPNAFDGSERGVEISGEVFFDVQKQADKPFKVTVGNQTITVLGTRFNVSAYNGESLIQTSLIEGKVKLKVRSDDYLLAPGQAAYYDLKAGIVRKGTFDERSVLAWQKGYFMFNEEPIQLIMQKIARWYDVEVVYNGDMRNQAFSGKISRFTQVQDVLHMLTLTGTIKFKIEGRRIYVMA